MYRPVFSFATSGCGHSSPGWLRATALLWYDGGTNERGRHHGVFQKSLPGAEGPGTESGGAGRPAGRLPAGGEQVGGRQRHSGAGHPLLALADALDLPLDTLCGRETTDGPSAAPAAVEPSVPPAPGVSPRLRLWQGLCGVLALLLLAGGVWIWYQRSTLVPSEDAPAESTLPDTFSAAGESFSWDSTRELLDFRFIPGIADETCSYQITFTGTDNVPHTFDALYSGGVCTGSAELTPWDVYDVTVSVSDGTGSRAALLARSLTAGPGNVVQWTPAEE